MDSDDLIFGAVYQVLLLVQGHSAAEYASCLQSADFTSYQDLVLWHVSIYYNMTTYIYQICYLLDKLQNWNKSLLKSHQNLNQLMILRGDFQNSASENIS